MSISRKTFLEARKMVLACGGVVAWNENGAPEPRDANGHALRGPFGCKLPTYLEALALDCEDDVFAAVNYIVYGAKPVVPSPVNRWFDTASKGLSDASALPRNFRAQALVRWLDRLGDEEALATLRDPEKRDQAVDHYFTC